MATRTYISKTYSEKDVITGRGARSNDHPGNQAHHNICDKYYYYYKNLGKRDKYPARRLVVLEIELSGGKYLQYEESTNQWFEMEDEAKLKRAQEAIRYRFQRLEEEGRLPTPAADFGDKIRNAVFKQTLLDSGLHIVPLEYRFVQEMEESEVRFDKFDCLSDGGREEGTLAHEEIYRYRYCSRRGCCGIIRPVLRFDDISHDLRWFYSVYYKQLKHGLSKGVCSNGHCTGEEVRKVWKVSHTDIGYWETDRTRRPTRFHCHQPPTSKLMYMLSNHWYLCPDGKRCNKSPKWAFNMMGDITCMECKGLGHIAEKYQEYTQELAMLVEKSIGDWEEIFWKFMNILGRFIFEENWSGTLKIGGIYCFDFVKYSTPVIRSFFASDEDADVAR